ncbi:MAG: 16S rRNA (uracil(1498)-N(3))-methyltransferase [Pseudomonadota bacterium]
MTDAKIRLYLDHALQEGQCVALNRDQAQYLFKVMRQPVGAAILVFNGRDGEWFAKITDASKRSGQLSIERQTRLQKNPPDLWLLFAPIKKARTDFIVEKAAELGAARIQPVQTEFTNAERIRQDRLQAHAVEAAEQCGGTFVPEVGELAKLGKMLADWPSNRQLMICDETTAGESRILPVSGRGQPWAILIGPEGGFSENERATLRALSTAHIVSLGPRILRADTAAVAALTLWQSALGDWA